MDARNHDYPLQLEDQYSSEAEYGYGAGPRSTIGVADILETLRRGWRYPVYGLLVGLAAAAVYVVSVKVPYKSSARILIDRSVSRYLQTNKIIDQPILDESEIASQVYVLSSDSVILPVVKSLKLAHDSEFVSQRDFSGVTVLDHLAKLKEMFLRAVGWDAGAGAGSDPERIAAEALLKRLTVFREDVANVISVSFESQDPKKAAEIVNALADTYIENTLDAKLKSTKVVSQWLQERLIELKRQVGDAERALHDYKSANNLLNSGIGAQNPEQRANLNTQLTNARIAAAEAKQRFDRIQQKAGEEITTTMETDAVMNQARGGVRAPGQLFSLNNNELVRLRAQYREMAARATELESRVGPKNAIIIKLRRQIDVLRSAIRAEEQRIADSYANDYQVAKATEDALAARVAQLSGGTETSSQLQELESSAENLRNLYNSSLQKFNEVNTVQTDSMPVQNARIITRAAPPLYKSPKKPLAILAGSTMLGLLLGGGILFAREWAADVFRTAKAVEKVSDRKCVILPKIETKSTLIEEFVLDAPYSRFTETFRDIKALIDAAPCGPGAKIIGIVSSVPDEGKTIVASNLASLIVASSGARTLVIDSDLHLRKLTAMLAPKASEGVIDALEKPARLSELVVRRPRSGLDVLPCPFPSRIPNAAELLGSAEMEQLLAFARKSYDYIIIEIAPIMSVVDVKTIERFIDVFVFVVEWGQTKRSLVQDALSEAHAIRDRLVGVVLNKADPDALRNMESYKGDKFRHYYQD